MIKYLLCICLFLFSCYAQKPERGIDGNDGKNGLNGAQGIKGDNGKDGLNGSNGKDGVDGPNVFIQGSRIKPKYSSVSFEDGTSYLYLGGQSNDPKSIIWVDSTLNIDCQLCSLSCPNENPFYCLPLSLEKDSVNFVSIENYQGRYYPDLNFNNFFWVYSDQNCKIPYLTNHQIIDKSKKFYYSNNSNCNIIYSCNSFVSASSSAYYFDAGCKQFVFQYFDCVDLQIITNGDVLNFAKANFTFEAK